MNWILILLPFVIAAGVSVCYAQATALPQRPAALDSAVQQVPAATRALVLLDTRLHKLIAADLTSYTKAAAARRGFPPKSCSRDWERSLRLCARRSTGSGTS